MTQHPDISPLATDLYQLTMAYGYWKHNLHHRNAVFHLFFREHPFDGEFTIAAGLDAAIAWLQAFQYSAADLAYLATLTGATGKPLFDAAFLQALAELRLTLDIAAIPEGTVVFPHEPLVRVSGPLWQCQLVETTLLNLINFETLIATKAARICLAAGDDPVLEFGLRRAQGPDGGLRASRAAYIGGCSATSNVAAGQSFGIPVKGTHAHSWVMSFPTELEAFAAYAEAMPDNCTLLVDTYSTIDGVRNAVEIGKQLRARGYELRGVRLDSGDLLELSIAARRILDEGGFPHADIVASNDLDEYRITALKEQGSQISVWGVGTRLVTAYDQPALGGVYKLTALQDDAGEWQYRIKLSNTPIKVSQPGILQVLRYSQDGQFCQDVIYHRDSPPGDPCRWSALTSPEVVREVAAGTTFEDLLVPIFTHGELIYSQPAVADIRSRAKEQLGRLPAGCRLLRAAEPFSTGLEQRLQELKLQLIANPTTTKI